MFSMFPSLFTFSFFAPTLLRIVASLAFLFFAYRLARHTRMHPGSGTPFTWYIILAEIVVGGSLFVGLYTQIGAILGVLLSFKLMYFVSRKKYIAPYDYLTYALLVAICLSLLLLGAGAFAFDLPL
jgi:hypothetical protein